MSTEMRFGIIGEGDEVLQAYQELSTAENAQVSMVMASNPGARRDLGAMITVPIVETVDEVCTHSDVEAVYITLGAGPREEAATKAVAAGKHLLFPEPWDPPLDEALALCALADELDVRLGIAAPWAVDGGHLASRMLARAGLLGEIASWRADLLRPEPMADPLRLALPTLALFGWLTDLGAEQVYAQQAPPIDEMSLLILMVCYSNGCVGNLRVGSGIPGGVGRHPEGLRMLGSEGRLDLSQEPMVYRTRSTEDAPAHTWRPVRAMGSRGDIAQTMAQFAAQVQAGEEPPLPARALLQPLRILEAARRSLAEGAPAPIAD